MKKILLVSTYFFLFLFVSFCYADETQESALSRKIFEIVMEMDENKMNIAIDYSVEILNNKPWSIDAYGAISLFESYTVNKETEKKYHTFKAAFFSSIEDLSVNTGEKLVLLNLFGAAIEDISPEENKQNITRIIEILTKNKTIVKSREKLALIYMMLFYDRENFLTNLNEFIEKFPDHPAIPLMELDKISMLYKSEPKICIDKVEVWMKKYDNVMSPLGWKLNVNGYEVLLNSYFELNDTENIKKTIRTLYNISPLFFKGLNEHWLDYLEHEVIIKK